MVSIVKFGERVEKSQEYPDGWKEIYTYRKGPKTTDSLLGHKSVICLPGDGVINEEDMNGCCKHIKKILLQAGMPLKEIPRLYSLGFDTEDCYYHRMHILEKNKQTRYGLSSFRKIHAYWKPFFDLYILPLIQDDKGQAYPMNKTIKNLRNITFLTHCHGGMVAYQLEKMMAQKIHEFYPTHEKEVLGNVRMVHFASRKPVGKKTGVKHFNVVSLADDSYADWHELADDQMYKILHDKNEEKSQEQQDQKKKVTGLFEKNRTALIPVSPDEAIMMFLELATPKTYGIDRDDHRQFLQVISREEKTVVEQDEEAKKNQPGIKFVRSMFRHFVEHPDDQRSMNEIMAEVDFKLTAQSMREGKKLKDFVEKEQHESKTMLDLLSQNRIAGVSGKSKFYLQRMSNGQYFFQHILDQAQKTEDTESLKKILKVSNMVHNVSEEVLIKGLKIALETQDQRLIDFISKNLRQSTIVSFLKTVNPVEMPKLYGMIKRANLGQGQESKVIDDLLEKSEKIKNSTGRVRVQKILRAELEKSKKNDSSQVKKLIAGLYHSFRDL